ncbi:hypothetical protein [Streptomyces sp. NPDC051569]|uniref:hypothetical protein n=1 Tax=Streptomyces sp. NPDC051569 TaxID=3365661 RepID=UPI0037BCDA31
MNPVRRSTAVTLVAAGLIAAGASTAAAAPAPERITSAAQLQAHLAKAIDLENSQTPITINCGPAGQKAT